MVNNNFWRWGLSHGIQSNILEFDEKGFSWEPQASSMIMKILGFSYLRMNGFDTSKAKVGKLSMLVFFPKQWCGWRPGQGFIDGNGSPYNLVSTISISIVLGPLTH